MAVPTNIIMSDHMTTYLLVACNSVAFTKYNFEQPTVARFFALVTCSLAVKRQRAVGKLRYYLPLFAMHVAGVYAHHH